MNNQLLIRISEFFNIAIYLSDFYASDYMFSIITQDVLETETLLQNLNSI